MKLDFNTLPSLILARLAVLKRYRLIIFIVFVVGIYGYLVLQINSATSVEPATSQEVTAAQSSPKLDPEVVKQLQELQDNSVSVKALFNQARTNPFE